MLPDTKLHLGFTDYPSVICDPLTYSVVVLVTQCVPECDPTCIALNVCDTIECAITGVRHFGHGICAAERT